MKHFTLENGTVLKSEKQTAEAFRKLHKKAWFINADDVEKSPIGTIQNSRFTSAPHLTEPFFHIPLDKAKLVHITESKDD